MRSLRARRRLTVFGTLALGLGLLVIAESGPWRDAIFSAGPLIPAHARTPNGCASCHSSSLDAPGAWLSAAVRPASGSETSARCLDCHQGADPAKGAATNPHGRTATELSRRPHRPAPDGGFHTPLRLLLADRLAGHESLQRDGAECATCHREHRGRDHSLTALSDEQCQACHARKFASFSQGHPEFTEFYPHFRRTRIAYNHAAHEPRLASPERPAGAPSQCLDCHESDRTQRFMVLTGFDAACAACHGERIRSFGEVAFIQLPSVDHESLTQAGLWIGAIGDETWPMIADGAETELGPFLKLLLSADSDRQVAADIERLQRERVALYALEGVDRSLQEAATRVIWAIKRLVHELAQGGDAAIRAKLERVFAAGAIRGPAQLASMLGLPEDVVRQDEQTLAWVIRQAADRWLGDVEGELRQYEARGPLPPEPGDAPEPVERPAKPEAKAPTPLPPERTPRWHLRLQDQAIVYVPTGHADPFLRSWLDALGAPDQTAAPRAARTVFDSLRDRNAPGRCGYCHSVDAVSDDRFAVNWRGRGPTSPEGELTRFAHAPHFNFPSLNNCGACHSVRKGLDPAAWRSAYAGTDPNHIAANLSPIRKADCIGCHKPGAAGEGCLECHRYHSVPLSATPATSPVEITLSR